MNRRRALIAAQDSGIAINGASQTWETGVILNTTGEIDSTYPTFISTSNYIPVSNSVMAYTGALADEDDVPYTVSVFQYDASKALICRNYAAQNGAASQVVLFSEAKYLRISFGHPTNSGANMNVSDGDLFSGYLSKRTTDHIYLIENHTVESNGEVISVDVIPFSQGVASTIVLDITTTANPTTSGNSASLAKYMSVYGSSRLFGIGKYARSDTGLSIWWQASSNSDYAALTGATSAAGRKRFVVTHEADSGNITVYSKMGTGTLNTKTLSKTFSALRYNIKFGEGTSPSTAGLPQGTLSKAAVYDRVWTQAEIDAFFE